MAVGSLLKVCLTNQGEDIETPWAEDLGPASDAPPGSRKVRLSNVPSLHAKPTWGDVIVVSPREGSRLTWDRDGTPWEKISSRILEDGGRYAMIVDYTPRKGATDRGAFQALSKACEGIDIVCEGAFGPGDGHPGRAYLAVLEGFGPSAVMAKLRAVGIPARLTLIHPEG